MHNWNVFKNLEQASVAAADFLEAQIRRVLDKQPKCHIALPGGNTPAQCLALLSQKDLPWHRIAWYLGDERCYPSGHAERNDVMLEKNLWSKLAKPEVYVIPAELGAAAAADAYRETIDALPMLDIVFLGMGQDGHTASLFPDNPGLEDSRSVIPVYDAPKAPADRVSLGVSTLKKAGVRLLLAGGADKSEVINLVRQQVTLPVNRVGDIHWFVDENCYA